MIDQIALRAVIDTNVLYPRYLRDLILRLANAGAFELVVGDEILEELTRQLARIQSVGEAKATRIASLIRAHFGQAVVARREIRSHIEGVAVNERDRHVVATAVAAGAHWLVTFNLKDFPDAECARFGIRAVHPDDFLCRVAASRSATFDSTVVDMIAGFSRPPISIAELASVLTRAGLPSTGEQLRERLRER